LRAEPASLIKDWQLAVLRKCLKKERQEKARAKKSPEKSSWRACLLLCGGSIDSYRFGQSFLDFATDLFLYIHLP
jgi:hypothetical protein